MITKAEFLEAVNEYVERVDEDSYELALHVVRAEEMAFPEKVNDVLFKFLISHEEDINLGINDFGDLIPVMEEAKKYGLWDFLKREGY